MDLKQQLEEILKGAGAEWSKADRTLAEKVGRDLAKLYARQVAGKDVDEELKVAKASARNIAAGASLSGVHALREALAAVLMAMLKKI